jgi:fatty acid desaturase
MAATPQHHPSLHERVESITGSGDLRLIYGMGVPMFIAVLVICGLLVAGVGWAVPVLMLMIAVMTFGVIMGIAKMLGESGDEDDAGA